MTEPQIHQFIKTLIGLYAKQNDVEIKLTWKGEKKQNNENKNMSKYNTQ